jgi:hypothetical protein
MDCWDDLPVDRQAEVAKVILDAVVKVMDENRPIAKQRYIENLQRRAAKQPFGGLPRWQRYCLMDCDEPLADELCDACDVPHGSTIGYSIREGQHLVDLSGV